MDSLASLVIRPQR